MIGWLKTMFLLSAALVYADDEQSAETPSVTIQKWQYCAGCKATVEIFGIATGHKMQELQQSKAPPGTSVDVDEIAENICSSPMFNPYQDFVRYSCVKLLNENKYKFLSSFEGEATAVYGLMKGETYKKTKDICVTKANACSASEFERGNIPPKKRDMCAACRIVMDDIETIKKVALSYSNIDIVESICGTLGYNHSPYTWIEEKCEEMIDDFSDDIVDKLNMRDYLTRNKMQPAHSLSDKVCGELYDCAIPEL